MAPIQLFGTLVERGVMHNNTTTSTSISTPVSSMCDPTVHGLDSGRRPFYPDESTGDANSDISHSQRIWSQLDIHKTAGQGSEVEVEVQLASAAVVVSAAASVAQDAAPVAQDAAPVAKASLDAALHANLMVDAVVISSDAVSEEEAVSNRIETDSADVTRENNLNLICKEAKLAEKAFSDVLPMAEPNPLKPAELVQSGPSDFGEELDVTSEILAKPTKATEVGTTSTTRYKKAEGFHNLMNAVPSNSQTNIIKEVSLVEDDASSAKQTKLDTPGSEVGIEPRGKDVWKDDNLQSVDLESLRPCDTEDDKDSDTSMTNEYSGIVFSVPKPVKNTYSVELDSRFIPERKSGHRASKAIEVSHVSKIGTKEKGGPSYKAVTNRREYHDVSSEGLSSQNKGMENKSLQETSSLRTSRKRKLSSSINDDVHRKENVAYSSETSDQNEVKDLVSNTNPGKLGSDVSEPRRSSRKIQPTSRFLEGLETSFISRGPLQRRSNSSQGSTGTNEGCSESI